MLVGKKRAISTVTTIATAYVTINEIGKLTFAGVLLALKWYSALEQMARVMEKYTQHGHKRTFTM